MLAMLKVTSLEQIIWFEELWQFTNQILSLLPMSYKKDKEHSQMMQKRVMISQWQNKKDNCPLKNEWG